MFSDVRESLPQTLANLEIVIDMLKRYHPGVEQVLVFLPQLGSIVQAISAPYEKDRMAALDLTLAINYPPPCLTGFRPASEWRSPSDTSIAPLRDGQLLPDPAGLSSQRGARRAQHAVHGCPGQTRADTTRTAAAENPTCRWAPTRGSATPTRSGTARHPAPDAISRWIPAT